MKTKHFYVRLKIYFSDNYKFNKRTERERVTEIESDLLFQKFYQEVIKNFNSIDHKILMDSQRQQRDYMNLKAEMDDLRRLVKNQNTQNNSLLEKGELEKHIEKNNTSLTMKILELETKTQRNLTGVNEDFNFKLNTIQDQIGKI